MGVSRAVMREAFGALAALRLIDVGNGRRARVGAIDGSVMAASIDHAVATEQVSTAEVWDVRRTLELRTAELAATHRTDEQAARPIARHAAGMATSANDVAVLIGHDIAFHQAISQAGGNALFLQIVRSFEPLMRVAVPTAWDTRRTEDQRSVSPRCPPRPGRRDRRSRSGRGGAVDGRAFRPVDRRHHRPLSDRRKAPFPIGISSRRTGTPI
ncbi:FadR/GntR family transcriptional regulator [Sphingomonas sp. MMS24-JH45]